MPEHIKLIARLGNGLAAVLFGLFALLLLKSNPGGAIVMLAVLALALFNMYVIEKCIRFFSEEETLKTEIRKAELRRELAELQDKTEQLTSGPRNGASTP